MNRPHYLSESDLAVAPASSARHLRRMRFGLEAVRVRCALWWSLVLCVSGGVVPAAADAASWYRAVSFAELGYPETALVNEHGQWVAAIGGGHVQYFDGMQRSDWGLGAEPILPDRITENGDILGRALIPTRTQTSEGEIEELVRYSFLVLQGHFSFWGYRSGPGDPVFLSDGAALVGMAPSLDFGGFGNVAFVTDDDGWETFDADMVGEHGIYFGNVTPLWMNRSGAIVGQASFLLGETELIEFGEGGPYYWPVVGRFAFVRENGVLRSLVLPGDSSGIATRINDAGTIIGTSSHSGFVASGRLLVRWDASDPTKTVTPLVVNNAGVVVGRAAAEGDAGPGEFLLWRAGAVSALETVTDFSGTDATRISSVIDIHDNGRIIVDAVVAPEVTRRFLLVPVQPLAPARLANVSMRATTRTGDATLISGFVVAGGDGRILARGVGPGLNAHGVPQAAADPRLDLFREGEGLPIAANDDWSDSSDPSAVAADSARVGAFALADGSADAALLDNLPAGAYTVHAGATAAEGGGVVLSEVYDAGDAEGSGRLVNASMRLWVGTGADIGIFGFVLAGEFPARVLIRAVGPRLADFNVAGVLSDPQILLYRGQEPTLSNDDWGSSSDFPLLSDARWRVGAFELTDKSKDAALLLELEPGAYTVHVSGADGGTGVVLVEIYLMEE